MSFGGLYWSLPWLLLLLPLVLLPWWRHKQEHVVAWSRFVPVDPLSRIIGLLFKILASIAIAGLVFAFAGPYLPEKEVERIGEGAEIVLLLDRSRSMDDPFAGSVETVQVGLVTPATDKSKRRMAGRFLNEFIQRRPDDRFGFVLFSSEAFDLLPLTYSKEAILATVNASMLGKGLSDTNITKALVKAAKLFEGETYRGARIVLLVSDGGSSELDLATQERIINLYKKQSLTIYWIYLRSRKGMTLDVHAGDSPLWVDLPERHLHAFFKSSKLPYRAFEADTLEDFSKALDDINEQQYQTLVVTEITSKEDKRQPFFVLALLALFALLLSQLYTVWGVRQAHG